MAYDDRSSDWRGVCYAVTATLTPMIAAMSLGFTSSAISTMAGTGKHSVVPPNLLVFTDDDASSWFASLVNIGALVGALGGSWFCNYFGMRGTLQTAAILLCAPWAVVAYSSDVFILLCMRTIMGVGVGLQSVATPMFIAEVSPLHLRGTLGTLNAAAILFGIVVVDLAGGSIFRDGKFCAWRSLSIFISACAGTFLLVSALLPEPRRPKVLRRCRPRATCAWDASPDQADASQAANLTTAADIEEPITPTTPNTPTTPATRRRDSTDTIGRRASIGSVEEEDMDKCRMAKLAIAGVIPLVWQQLSGYNTITFFGQDILRQAGIEHFEILGSSVIGVQLLGIAIAAGIIEQVGRRPLLLVSSGGMALSAGVAGFVLGMASPPGMAVMACFYAYVMFFAVGLGPVAWLLLPELGLPRRLRGYLASLATAANWACSFAVTGPPVSALRNAIHLNGEFYVFAAMCLIGFLLMLCFLPETRRRRRFGLERQLFSRASWSRTFSRTFSGTFGRRFSAPMAVETPTS